MQMLFEPYTNYSPYFTVLIHKIWTGLLFKTSEIFQDLCLIIVAILAHSEWKTLKPVSHRVWV